MRDSLIQSLRLATADFETEYKDNPSYAEVLQKLKQAMYDLDLATMSHGQQAARSAASKAIQDHELALRYGQPLPSGQGVAPSGEQMKVQKTKK